MAQNFTGRVFCIVPIFNRLQSTLECIRCIKAQTFSPISIIVVDGGSTDGSQATLRAEHPDVVLLEGKNLWWAGATRLGIDWALRQSTDDNDFIMLLNNDTVFGKDYVETIVNHSLREKAAICGVVVDAHQPDRVIDAGVDFDWKTYRFKRLREMPEGQRLRLDSSVLPGRGTIVPIYAIRLAGNVDDVRFPHYLADYEFTYRLRTKGGIRLGVAYDAKIYTREDRQQSATAIGPWRETWDAIKKATSKRSKSNLLYHYRFIDAHAPAALKRGLKRQLFLSHLKRLGAPLLKPRAASSDHRIFDAFAPVSSQSTGQHVFDFVGTATRVAYKRKWARSALPAGRTVNPGRPPKNEHYLDWVALLTAVDRARGTFRMAELGAGWAPWLIRGALAARQRPKITAVELLAVEADPVHYAWMLQHFRDNDLDPEAYHILHGAVAGKPGRLRFPVIENPDVDYGASLAIASRAEQTIEVMAYTLPDLLARFTGPLDFLHVDIQGAEYEALPPAMRELTQNVKSIMIGTHQSDVRHDELVETLRGAGWREVVALGRNRTHTTPWGEITLNDGFLLFENPKFV